MGAVGGTAQVRARRAGNRRVLAVRIVLRAARAPRLCLYGLECQWVASGVWGASVEEAATQSGPNLLPRSCQTAYRPLAVHNACEQLSVDSG